MPINPQTVPTMLKTNKIIISLKCSEPRIELILPNAHILIPKVVPSGIVCEGKSTIKREKKYYATCLVGSEKTPYVIKLSRSVKGNTLHFVVNYNEQVKTYLEGKIAQKHPRGIFQDVFTSLTKMDIIEMKGIVSESDHAGTLLKIGAEKPLQAEAH